MKKEDFIKEFNERVLVLLEKTCTLLDIKPNITYLNEDFTTIINVVLFYTGIYKIKDDDQLNEIYCFQMDIAHDKLLEYYKDFVKKYLNDKIEENDDILFYRLSDMNFNTAIFFGGDNFDGFNITLTDE